MMPILMRHLRGRFQTFVPNLENDKVYVIGTWLGKLYFRSILI